MRLLALLALLLLAGVAAADHGAFRHYVGATTREPLTGPVVVCDREGNGVGGACFDAPFERGFVSVIVHDDLAPPGVPIAVMMAAYGADLAPLPIDSAVSCAQNHEPVTFRFERFTERIVVALGPWAGGGGVQWGPTCAGLPGTTGTIELVPLRAY